jgi:PKD repeat protein
LADNGGPTQTHALLAGSPALNAGSNLLGLSTDQRGLDRQVGAAVDIGAFEFVPPPGVTITPTTGLVTTEAGGTATFSVVLASQPTADVTITFTSSNTAEGTVTPSITFTPANWNVAQTVTVTGVDDNVDDGDVAYTIVTAVQSADPLFAAINPADVQVTNRDNDLTAAILGAPASSPEGTAINLTSAASDVGTATSFTYAWSVTKNGTPFATGSNATFAFTPDDDGSYVVTLAVTGNEGSHGSAQATIAVTNVGPQNVSAGGNQSVNEGDLVTLHGTFSDPGSADTHTFLWHVQASNGQVVADGTGQNFVFTPADEGTYTVTFTVRDDDGASASTQVVVTVNNVEPRDLLLSGPAGGVPGTPLSFSGSFTDPGADTWTATVNYGDGSGAQPLALGPDKAFAFTHAYATPGQYMVTVGVRDDDMAAGTYATVSTQVTIRSAVQVTGVGIDDGTDLAVGAVTGTGQHSALRRLQLALDTPLAGLSNGATFTFANNAAFSVAGLNLGLVRGQGGPAFTVSVRYNVVGAGARLVLTFGGGSGDSQVLGGSLNDGDYTLTVNGQQKAAFYRLFGDVNGDRKVDDTDLAAFQRAYRSTSAMANYRSYFDYNNDGSIDSTDYYRFLRRYRTGI